MHGLLAVLYFDLSAAHPIITRREAHQRIEQAHDAAAAASSVAARGVGLTGVLCSAGIPGVVVGAVGASAGSHGAEQSCAAD